jgi:hypothetical protein
VGPRVSVVLSRRAPSQYMRFEFLQSSVSRQDPRYASGAASADSTVLKLLLRFHDRAGDLECPSPLAWSR